MNDKILEILNKYAINEENQAGVKGDVIWDDDFYSLAAELEKLFAIPAV